MNRYQTPGPRKAFAVASIALTALTVGLAVVVPAKVGSVRQDIRTLAPIEVVARPAHIDVVGTPDAGVISVQVGNPMPKPKQES